MAEPIVATYSIVAVDLDAEQWGVAVQSKFLSVGSVVPWAEPHVGAVATQAYANPRYGPNGLELLLEGLSAQEVVERLTSEDEGRDHRQLGIVDANGNAATYTGKECMDWAGGRTGEGYAAQGNILVSGETVDAIAESFEESTGPLAVRLIDCLAAAQEAGGDSRGQQSSALLVVQQDGGYAGYVRVPADWVVRIPDGLTSREAMVLGTAGFTAGLAIVRLLACQTHGAIDVISRAGHGATFVVTWSSVSP